MTKVRAWERLTKRRQPRAIEVWASGTGQTHRLEVGQRFHRVGLPEVIWRVESVYRDALGVEHATLADIRRRHERKTLSAAAILDHSRYHPI